MKLGEFRRLTKSYTDDFELVINNLGDRDDIPCWGVINYTKTASGQPCCLIMPADVKMSFKDLLEYIKEYIFNWAENNMDEETRNNLCFWLNPIGGFAQLDISLRSIAGRTVWHRIIWYNFHLLLFKIGGKFRILCKSKQEYYDALIDMEEQKEERR